MSKASESVRQAIRLLGEENPYGKAVEDLLKERDGLLEAMDLAFPYVKALHANISAAMGHENTPVRGDLEKICAAIAKAKGE